MAMPSFGQSVADAWVGDLRERPDPFRHDNLFSRPFLGLPRQTYRERLDEQPRNFYGELIPRIVTVRRHLRALKAGR